MDASVLSYKECISAITDAYLSGMRAALLDGPPGGGKTTMAKYIQEAMGLKHRFIIKPGHHDTPDFNGLPAADLSTMTAHFLPFDSLLPPSDIKGGCLMTWDEVGDSERCIQNLVCQAIFEGGFHNYTFPENTYHFLTSNRVADRSGANRIVTKMGNRVGWWTLEPTVDELFDYGVANSWNPTVLAFLKLRGGDPINPNDRAKDGRAVATYFNSFDPSDPQQMIKPVFSSSRSMEFVSNMMNYLDRTNPNISMGALLSRVSGLIGTPWASAFAPFRDEASMMPNPDDILAGKKVPFPKQSSVLWTLTISLVTKVQKGTWKHMAAWLKQGPDKEFYILAIRMAFDTRVKDLIGPDFNATLQEPDVKQALTAK